MYKRLKGGSSPHAAGFLKLSMLLPVTKCWAASPCGAGHASTREHMMAHNATCATVADSERGPDLRPLCANRAAPHGERHSADAGGRGRGSSGVPALRAQAVPAHRAAGAAAARLCAWPLLLPPPRLPGRLQRPPQPLQRQVTPLTSNAHWEPHALDSHVSSWRGSSKKWLLGSVLPGLLHGTESVNHAFSSHP